MVSFSDACLKVKITINYYLNLLVVSAFLPSAWHSLHIYRVMFHSKTSLTGPSRVSGVSLNKTMTSGVPSLMVTWNTPQSDRTISQYQVQYRRSRTTSWSSATPLSVSPPTTDTNLTGLDVGTEYTVRVRAVSELGAGMWSEEQTERTVDREVMHSVLLLASCICTCSPYRLRQKNNLLLTC